MMYRDMNDSLNQRGLSVHIILPAFSQSRFSLPLRFIKKGFFKIFSPGEVRMKSRHYWAIVMSCLAHTWRSFTKSQKTVVRGPSGALVPQVMVRGNLWL